MTHKLRKIRKKRGSRTQGFGRVGQHRKSGGKGKRKPGRHKAGWSYIQTYDPDYFKKEGLKPKKSQNYKIINLSKLEELSWQILVKKKNKPSKLHIDLEKIGYHKLLGTGRITVPLSVRVSYCSGNAQKKIEAVGGEITVIKS
jgi:large subunit ribosomal protein L15